MSAPLAGVHPDRFEFAREGRRDVHEVVELIAHHEETFADAMRAGIAYLAGLVLYHAARRGIVRL